MQYATKKDIQDLLELLNTTNDIEIQVKIFSLFACYLISGHSTNSDLIITSHFVYDKIYSMLMRGLPKKITVTLNFVSALLLETEDDACTTKQSLALHARNMLRVSGCLALLSNLFNSCMVHQETWTALCRSVTEVCRHSQENQSYCSDLIPTGIRRCASGDMESYQVLQSLLHKHDRNTQQFIECNGLTIFTREKLHNTFCLKLVNAVAQNPKAVVLLVHKTEIVEILRNFLNLYGKESLNGQWATIILYNIKTFIKDFAKEEPKETKTNDDYRFCIKNEDMSKLSINKNKHGDTTELLQNVFREMLQSQKEDYVNNIAPTNNGLTKGESGKYTGTNLHSISNVMKSNVYSTPFTNMQARCSRAEHSNKPVDTPNRNLFSTAPKKVRRDLSFSFLLNENLDLNSNKNFSRTQQFTTVSYNLSDKDQSFAVTTTIVKQHEGNNKFTRDCYNVTDLVKNIEDCNENRSLDFKPVIASTPKRSPSRKILHRNNSIKYKKEERRILSHDTFKHRKAPMAEVKNKSFSGKFFSAINDSCTMLVKTVKNIFTTKHIENNTGRKELENMSEKKAHPNYSFMDYMRRRDAIMGTQYEDTSSEKKSCSSCETCNNTVLLKRKLEKDYQLKRTLKKLKFGINLYGCDFKKISATMWPRDSYMTPTVLYNLYRKLIVK